MYEMVMLATGFGDLNFPALFDILCINGSTENAVVRYQSRYQRYCSKIGFVVSTAFSVHFWKVPHFPYKANRGTNCEEFK